MTATRAPVIIERLRLAECGDPIDGALEQDPALVNGWVPQTVGGIVLRVLGPDLVQLSGDPFAVHGVVLEDLEGEQLENMRGMLLAMDPPRHNDYRRTMVKRFAPPADRVSLLQTP